MDFLIITSSRDIASMNVRDNLLKSKSYSFELVDFEWHNQPVFKLENHIIDNKRNLHFKTIGIYLGLTDERLIFLDDLKLNNSFFSPDFIIFASRHTSKTSRPALLAHTTGNWTQNTEFGGNPWELSQTSAILHKAGFLSLLEQNNIQPLENYVVDIEVTHHGPTNIEKPLVYMELGSSKTEWINYKAGELVANAIISTCFYYLQFKERNKIQVGLGFGGTHYAPNFNRLIRNNDIAVSFICPKYFIQNLNYDMIQQMIQNTYEEVDFFILDWKGTNSNDKKYLIPLLEQFSIPIKKTKEF